MRASQSARHGRWIAVNSPGADFARFTGTDGNDLYFGTKRDDTINGAAGNDTLAGGDGEDVIDGGDGDDNIAGDGGDDRLNGGAGNDLISSSAGADTVEGGDGFDRWIGNYGSSAAALTFSEATGSVSNGTTLAGIEAIDLITGVAGDNIVLTGQRRAVVDGGSGIDALTLDVTQGAFGSRRIRLAMDFDRSGDLSGTLIGIVGRTRQSIDLDFRNLESVALVGGRNADKFLLGAERIGSTRGITVDAGDGNDQISLAGSGHVVRAGAGDDSINTGSDGQTIDGGEGHDLWSTTLSRGITFDQATQSFSSGTTLSSVESLRLISQASSDLPGNTFNLTGSSDLYIFEGGANDQINIDLVSMAEGLQISGLARSIAGSLYWVLAFGETEIWIDTSVDHGGTFIDLAGTEDDDTFMFDGRVTKYVSSIDGAGGTDTLKLSLIRDVTLSVSDTGEITSNAGSFSGIERFDISIFYGGNTIMTGAGDDVIKISTYAKANEANRLSGGDGDDMITGGRAADLLKGDGGTDILTGNDGDDTLNGGAGDDVLNGGAGSDTAGYSDAAAGVVITIADGPQNTRGDGVDYFSSIENVNGSAFDDQLTGDFFANRLRGQDGDDRLFGLDGDDYLEGGEGVDRMTGGSGADTFALTKLADFAAAGRDRILDFSHAEGDKIDLSAIDPEKGGADQAFTFIGSDGFSGAADRFEVRAQDQGGGSILVQGDSNHDGVADFAFIVASTTPLVAVDFVL